MQFIVRFVLVFLTVGAAAPAELISSNSVHLFDYDSHQPLDLRDKILKNFNCGVIHDPRRC